MSKIQIIKCGLCGKDIKVGFILGQGDTIVENHPFYEMYLVQNDLAKQYFEEYQRNDSEKLMCNYPICEECFEKLLNKNIKIVEKEDKNESKSNN